MERLVWTSMLFPGYRPAVFDDIPITAIMALESVGTGTRYVFTALHRDEADFEKDKTSGWQQGTEISPWNLSRADAAKRCRPERIVRPWPRTTRGMRPARKGRRLAARWPGSTEQEHQAAPGQVPG